MAKVDSTWNRLMLLFNKDQFAKGDKLQLLLNVGLDTFDLSVGNISYISGNTYSIYDSTASALVGEYLPLSQTFCVAPHNYGDVVAISAVQHTSWRNQAAYDIFAYETYIGAPLKVGQRIFGTVHFADYQARSRDFSDREIAFIKLLSNVIGSTIAARSTKPLPSGFELRV